MRLAIALADLLDRLRLGRPVFRLYERLRAWQQTLLVPELRVDDGLPLPPRELRFRVSGDADAGRFIVSGRAHADRIQKQLGPPSGRWLDFGVGCGRIARHWQGFDVELYGCDADPELLAWTGAHLPFVRAARNEAAPPLHYPSGHFDAIYAFSVLTHLPAALQVAWTDEFARVLKPGGRLLLTTHGQGLLARMLPQERRQFAGGELVVRNERASGSNLCTSYHPPEWVRANLLGALEEVAWTPAAEETQDLWLLRSASSG